MRAPTFYRWFVIVAIVSVALNMRPALAAIGPLLDMIEASTGLSFATASLLTALPVFVMGLGAFGGRAISHCFSERQGISIGVALIVVACAARYALTSVSGLLLTATVAGIGIAVVQTLMPAFIKRSFLAESGRVFALYTTGIMAGAAIAAASSAGLAAVTGWPLALVIWAVPAMIALPLWWQATRMPIGQACCTDQVPYAVKRVFWRNARAWELMIFFGIGTGAYTLVLAWLTPFYTSLGWTASQAGLLLGGLTLTEVIAGLAVSAWVGRYADRRPVLVIVLLILIAGLLCLMVAPLRLAIVASALLGVGIGALFPLSLIVTMDHIDEPEQAGMLLAFVQGGGYLIASGMPLLAGVLRDWFAQLTYAWAVMAVGVVCLLMLCLRFSPVSYRRIDA